MHISRRENVLHRIEWPEIEFTIKLTRIILTNTTLENVQERFNYH